MTLEKIFPGDGWRLLGPDEITLKADEYFGPVSQIWSTQDKEAGKLAGCFIAVRRRIPAKPESMEIDDCKGKISVQVLDSGSVLILQEWQGGDRTDYVATDTTDSIRQLIAWLQQVAEWREAQESVAKTPPN